MTLESNNNKILNECKEIFNLKLEVDNMLSSRLGIHYNKYKLITDDLERNNIFQSMNVYIPFFLHNIWDNPESIVTILLEANKNDIKQFGTFCY